MGLFGFFAGRNINDGVEEFMRTSGAMLLDVRTREEYDDGHVQDSVNIPLDKISSFAGKVPVKSTPLFVYCYSGARSGQAVDYLKRQGYTNVKNIGGIASFRGKVVR